MKQYLEATPELGKEFYMNFHQKGKITMLNLLKFKSKADYTGLGSIKPHEELTGREAYDLYMECTMPHLKNAESRILFFGDSKHFLIGPDTRVWDAVLLVEHQSVQKFMEFAQNQEYLRTAGHRKAALADSRLLPSSEKK